MSGKAKFRLLLLFVLAGLAGYVGFRVFMARDPKEPFEAALRIRKEADELLAAKRFAEAQTRFDEAFSYAEHAVKRLEGGMHSLGKDEVAELGGKAHFLRAVALRDKHFAKAAAAGKPIDEITDTTLNVKYRSFYSIPDAKEREEAVSSVRGAFELYPKDPQILLESMRIELMSQPIFWDRVEKVARATLEHKKEPDARSLYLLAKHDFDQPHSLTRAATPADKRSAERMRAALANVRKVRDADKNYPVWRTVFLEAQVRRWFMQQVYSKGDEAKWFDELEELKSLLTDNVIGALARIRKGEGLTNLTTWDTDAVLGLHAIAADISLEEIRKRKSPDFAALVRVYLDTLGFCRGKIEAADPQFPPSLLIGGLLSLMNRSQTILSVHKHRDWVQGIEVVRPLLTKEMEKNRCIPLHVAQFSELLMREARLLRGDRKKADELRAEATKWLQDGMKNGKDRNLSLNAMMPFNMLAANVAFFTTGKREAMAEYLTALQQTRHPEAQAMALVLDGAADEMEGRLEKARDKLEQAIKLRGTDETVRAHAALANIYMAMGRPNHALISLANIQQVYQSHDELSDLEKEWVAQFLKSPQDLYALMVAAHLEEARNRISAHLRRAPKGSKIPYDLLKEPEAKVDRLLKFELPRTTQPGLTARIHWTKHLAYTQRVPQARREYEDLAKDFSDRLEVLDLQVMLAQMEAMPVTSPAAMKKLYADVDGILGAFLRAYPENQSAKVYWALWLSQTERSKESLAYLEEMARNMQTPADFRRVLASVLLAKGSTIPAHRLISHLPRNPEFDFVLTDLARNVEQNSASVRAAMMRHESIGLGRIMTAEDLYAKGEFDKSARAYAQALDFTKLKSFVQGGLIRSLFAFAGKDAEGARTLHSQLLTEFPQEPSLVLSYAYTFLLLEEIGNPADNWEIRRSMASALNVWETLQTRDRPATSAIPLTRAEFWFRANRFDAARAELVRAINLDRNNAAVYAAAITMILDDPARERRPELREYLEELKRLMPKDATTLFLQGRIDEFEGNDNRAREAYEQLVKLNGKDPQVYLHYLSLLDRVGDRDASVRVSELWRKNLPTDLKAAVAEVQAHSRAKNLPKARELAGKFVQDSVVRAAQVSSEIVDKDLKLQEQRRAQFLDDVRWRAELDLAQGFALGDAFAEAESRLATFPKERRQTPAYLQLSGEVYAKQKSWEKAAAAFDACRKLAPSNLAVANNLAYILSEHLNRPAQAKEVIADLRKPLKGSVLRSADRFPPELLDTIGSVFAKLDQPENGYEMVQFFRVGLQRYPNDPRVWLYLGVGNDLVGEVVQAENCYKTALEKMDHPGLDDSHRESLRRNAENYLQRLRQRTQR